MRSWRLVAPALDPERSSETERSEGLAWVACRPRAAGTPPTPNLRSVPSRCSSPDRAPARPTAMTSSPDEAVFVELFDEGGSRDAQPPRRLALVSTCRLKGLGDERALERLDAPAKG